MLWNKQNTRNLGIQGENTAKKYLCQQGLSFHSANFHSRFGEIDLIMQDADTWVFIEVKYRKSAHFGGPLSAISVSKQKKIQHTAAFFLQQQGLNAYNTACRFDVVALLGNSQQPEITWIQNAF